MTKRTVTGSLPLSLTLSALTLLVAVNGRRAFPRLLTVPLQKIANSPLIVLSKPTLTTRANGMPP